jgi:predicted RNA binding protein YcfA (HicA-like mRNA interferase family)
VSPKLPVVTSRQLAAVAQRLGFELRRQRGSHAVYVRASDNARVVIPMHSGVSLKPKTLRGIIEDLKLSVEEFQKLL